jgi:hypothetical protein
VIADALVWQGADAGILAAVGHLDDVGQYLLRALIYRAVTEHILGPSGPAGDGVRPDPCAPAVAIACELAASGR